MPRRHRPPSPGWRVFLRSHTAHIAAIDLFVVPTIGFKLLYGLVILRLERRRLVWTNATANPTAEWIARQIAEAFPWDEAPRYLIRDRDTSYGAAVTRRLRTMGIRDRPTAPRSPWQNGHVKRLIGSIRRECLDHVVVFGESHLRHLLAKYSAHYNEARRILRWTRILPFVDLRRQSGVSHQSRGSTVFIVSTFGWPNRLAQVAALRNPLFILILGPFINGNMTPAVARGRVPPQQGRKRHSFGRGIGALDHPMA